MFFMLGERVLASCRMGVSGWVYCVSQLCYWSWQSVILLYGSLHRSSFSREMHGELR